MYSLCRDCALSVYWQRWEEEGGENMCMPVDASQCVVCVVGCTCMVVCECV